MYPSLAGSGCHAKEVCVKVGQTFLSASRYSYRNASTGFPRAARVTCRLTAKSTTRSVSRPAKEKRPYPRIHAIREILKPAIRRDVGHGPRNQAGYTDEDHIFTGQQGDDTDCWRPQDFPNPYFFGTPGNGERRQPEGAKAGDEYREESRVARDFEPPPFLPVLTVNVVLEKGRVKHFVGRHFLPLLFQETNGACPVVRSDANHQHSCHEKIWD